MSDPGRGVSHDVIRCRQLDLWLTEHTYTLRDEFSLAARNAISDWLETHASELIEAIAREAQAMSP